MPEQKGWTLLEPETPKPLSDLELKKRGPAVSPFEVAWSCWPTKRAGWRPRSAPHSDLLAGDFLQAAIPLYNFFAPAFVWAEAAGP
jgi:hypothetical protein